MEESGNSDRHGDSYPCKISTLKPSDSRLDGSGENCNDCNLHGRRADDDDILSDKDLVDT